MKAKTQKAGSKMLWLYKLLSKIFKPYGGR